MGIEEKIEFLQTQVQQQQERIALLEQTLPTNESKYSVKDISKKTGLTIQGVLWHKRVGNLKPIEGKQRNLLFTHSAFELFMDKITNKK